MRLTVANAMFLAMTSSADIDGAMLVTSPTHQLARELWETIRLAAPMALTQLGQIAMTTTDLAWIGRLGEQAVAAAALAATIYFVSFTIGLGVVSAVAPLAAQAFGARDPRRVRRATRVGLWAALLISLPMTTFPLYGEEILRLLGQADTSARLAQHYLLGLVWGATPALWLIAIRGFMGALNRPEPVLWITLAAIPTNALLVYLLIYGVWGLPRLGLFGAGLGTTLVNVAMFLAGLWFAVTRRPFRKYHVFGRIWRIDWAMMRDLIATGVPISIALLMEFGLFSSTALLCGLIGTTAIAANQIALQVTTILFMVQLGIALATTVRVGHAVGRNDPPAVRRAGFTAMLLGIVLATTLTLIVIVWRSAIGLIFLGAAAADAQATIDLVATLLVVGATLFITDGLQTIAAGALRGMKDTRVPLVFALIGYWLVGFPSAWVLAFHAGLGAVGVWIGISVGTSVYAALLILRFRLLANRFGIV
jgi:multidrug resistance protein, MATE family